MIRSPLSRTLRSSSESRSCDRLSVPGPSVAAGGSANSRGVWSKSAGAAGRSARFSGGAVIVAAHSSEYDRQTVSGASALPSAESFHRRSRMLPTSSLRVWAHSLASTETNDQEDIDDARQLDQDQLRLFQPYRPGRLRDGLSRAARARPQAPRP